MFGVRAAALPVTGRHWCLGTSPGSSNSNPSKKLRIWSRLRGQTRSLGQGRLVGEEVGADVGDCQVAPRRDGVAQARHRSRRVVGIAQEVQDREQPDRHRPTEVQVRADLRIRE